jgi:Ca2+-transporting ATPase
MLAIIGGLKAPLKPSHILWVNLITDSLPALALGIDRNSNKNFMKRKPRGRDESLFSGGGAGLTIFYGILIATITLTAFLQLPLRVLTDSGLPVTIFNFQGVLEDPVILRRAQTYAFIVLGLSELFHAIGMKNVERSFFRTNQWSNKLMITAVLSGFIMQILVTRIPYLVDLFGTARLSLEEWIMLTVLSAMPLFAHELFVLNTILTEKKLYWKKCR